MTKLILKNKFVFLLISVLFSVTVNAQTNIFNTWRISNLIGFRDLNEYSMVAMGEDRWGYMLILNHDGTFISRNLPECGNDFSRNVSGNFMLVDDSHIRFILKKTSYSSLNKNNNSESEATVDLGIFYIYKGANSIRLIKSNGILQDDKDKMLYNEIMDSFNWKLYDFVWENTKGKSREEIVKDYFDHSGKVNFSNCKVVISKKETYGQVILVQQKDNFYFVIYDDFKKKVSLAYPRQ